MYAPAQVILASASPRRRELLKDAGIPFSVMVSGITEMHRPGETPTEYVRRNATEKAQAAADMCGSLHHRSVILGADTIVVSPERYILEKPVDGTDAARMLALLSGKSHAVISGVALINAADRQILWAETVTTLVTFRNISSKEIEAYVATGEPLDKAGAYAVQEKAAVFVESIQGSYTNVVGMPLCEVVEALKRVAGVFPFNGLRG